MTPNLRNTIAPALGVAPQPGVVPLPILFSDRQMEVVWPVAGQRRTWMRRAKVSVEGANAYVIPQETFTPNPQRVSLEALNAYVIAQETYPVNPERVSLEAVNVYVVVQESY